MNTHTLVYLSVLTNENRRLAGVILSAQYLTS